MRNRNMARKLKNALLWILPVLVFVPVFLASRFFSFPIPGWFDWSLLVFCSATVAFNPGLKQTEGIHGRLIAFILGFLVVLALLFVLGFALMAYVFGDAP
jgi:hypothetical protein